MAYGKDLLDGFETLYKRTDGVLESCMKTANFFHNLSGIEKDYSRNLSKFVQLRRKEIFEKAASTQKEVGTTVTAWDVILRELEKVAEHHNQFADKLENDISKAIGNYVKEKQKDRKKLEEDGVKLTKAMKATLENLQKSRQKYITLSKEAEVAEAIHTKGKGDLTMKPSQLAKLAAKSQQSSERAADADNEYQTTLTQTNQKQAEYYTSQQPALLSKFQQFEEERLKFMKEMSQAYATCNSEKPSFYNGTCDAISASIQAISVDSDIQAYVAENRTGVSQPPDIQYISYEQEANNQATSKPKSDKIPKYKGPASNDILTSKEWGLTSADQSLSAEEQKQKLKTQLDELEKAIIAETKSKDGLENLIKFYANDKIAQKKAEGELQESEQKLQKLMDTKNYLQSQMGELGGTESYDQSGYSYDQSYDQSYSDASYPKARGLYDYTATCDTELSFKTGDILTITEQDNSGWWYASLNGYVGYVPKNYVALV